MSFLDYFRDLFNGGRNRARRPVEGDEPFGENFRNPIWQNEDDDDDDLDDSRRPHNNFHFRVYSDPLEVTRFFEREMDNLLKSFFHGFQGFNEHDFSLGPALPEPSVPSLLPPEAGPKRSLRDEILKPDYNTPHESTERRDTDLDGRVTTDNLARFWGKETDRPSQTFSFRSSVKEFIRKPDGTIEEKQMYTDHEGNQKTVVTRMIGDKKYTTTTERTKTGEEIRRESVEELDKNQPLVPSGGDFGGGSNFDHSWWRTIFGPSPKL